MKKVITDIDIDELMSDWLERDGETFAHIRKKGTLDWDRNISSEGALSEYFIPLHATKYDVMKKAYDIASDFIKIMNPPKKVHLTVSLSATSRTDAKNVFVSTKIFDDNLVELGEQIDIFCGLAIHEGCHLCYTDFDFIKKVGVTRVEMFLTNLLEDERIEELCGEKTPGLGKFLAKTKSYYFGSYFLDSLGSRKSDKEETDLQRLLNLIISIIRYPKYLREEDIVKYARLLLRIKKIVIPYPKSTAECYAAAKKIAALLNEVYKETLDDSEKDKKMGDELMEIRTKRASDRKVRDAKEYETARATGTPAPSHKEEDAAQDAADEKEILDKYKKRSLEERVESAMDKLDEKEAKDKKDSKSGEGKSKGDKEGDGKGKSKDEIIVETLKDKAASSAMDSDFSKAKKDFTEHKIVTKSSEYDSYYPEPEDVADGVEGIHGKVIEGEVTTGSSEKVSFKKLPDNKSKYMDSYSRIQRYIPAIRKSIKGHCRDYKLILHSMRTGVLDPLKIVEARQGVPNVYMREGEVYTDKLSVVILVDESGSMSGDRIESARDAAILLNEGLKDIPDVELFIYGHTADLYGSGTTNIEVFRDKTYRKKYSLGSVKANKENRDGDAILETARAVRKQTKNNVIMFVLSDGEPAAMDYHGKSAIEDTKNKVLKAEKLGFTIVQICINPVYDPSRMFKHFLVLDNMRTLAFNLGKVLKKAIMDSAKVHTSM